MFTIIHIDKESRRLTAEDNDNKTCVTVTIHRDDKEGIEGLNEFKTGESLNITIEPVDAEKSEEKDQSEPEKVAATPAETRKADTDIQKKSTGVVVEEMKDQPPKPNP